ncbi:hypothetical protein BH11ACT4_BH11ACT4_02630 [soil metagenome]
MQINGFTRDETVRHPLVVALAVLLFAESAVLALAAIYLVIEILTASAASVVSAVAFTALVVLAAIWVGLIAANTLRGRAWIRAAAITWQVLQVVVAVGCLQGLFATPLVGWLLIAAAVAVVVLLFTRPVIAATAEREPRGQS